MRPDEVEEGLRGAARNERVVEVAIDSSEGVDDDIQGLSIAISSCRRPAGGSVSSDIEEQAIWMLIC
jgi:hypothetical protein